MASHQSPQGKYKSFLGTVTNAYPVGAQLDLTSAGTFWPSQGEANKVTILNEDTAIIIFWSFNGVADHGRINPAAVQSFTFDDFTPPGGKIWIRSDSATPFVQVFAWA
jgi:hypothetical protein